MTELRAITFDVTGTLIHSPRVAEIYAEVLTRHGLKTTPHEVRELLPVVWQEMACRTSLGVDRFLAHPQGARGWWRDFLDRLCEYLGTEAPTRFTAAELYHRFSQADAWEVFPDVRESLARLQGMGVSLAVVSNWDDRLGRLLTHLDLTRYFDAIVFSAALGVEKPDPRIFAYALELLDVAPEAAMHVGDDRRQDVEGALAAGMHALHLVRSETGASPHRNTRHSPVDGDLHNLAPLPGRIAAGGTS